MMVKKFFAGCSKYFESHELPKGLSDPPKVVTTVEPINLPVEFDMENGDYFGKVWWFPMMVDATYTERPQYIKINP